MKPVENVASRVDEILDEIKSGKRLPSNADIDTMSRKIAALFTEPGTEEFGVLDAIVDVVYRAGYNTCVQANSGRSVISVRIG